MSGIGSFFSSFFPTTHADSEDKPEDKAENASASAEEEEAPKDGEQKEEGGEAEEEEPEDEHPQIRAACESSPSCAPLKHHFEKCQEKVQAGEGRKGEDCVDEMCTCLRPCSSPRTNVIMMHCSEACAAPKIFAKLR
ncbi:hypothetical protein B0H19DRAFT_1175621 [Mycena capillaripes]|nr:hypothetical protein B0H19DRAFT_1175621 [Mycena capillaripes]